MKDKRIVIACISVLVIAIIFTCMFYESDSKRNQIILDAGNFVVDSIVYNGTITMAEWEKVANEISKYTRVDKNQIELVSPSIDKIYNFKEIVVVKLKVDGKIVYEVNDVLVMKYTSH